MKVNAVAIAKAAVALVFLTILPLFGQQLIPTELFGAFMQGFEVVGPLNKAALIGLAFSVMIIWRGHTEKPSSIYPAL